MSKTRVYPIFLLTATRLLDVMEFITKPLSCKFSCLYFYFPYKAPPGLRKSVPHCFYCSKVMRIRRLQEYARGFDKLLTGFADDLHFIEIRGAKSGCSPQTFIDF
jgi:hypothetical protein